MTRNPVPIPILTYHQIAAAPLKGTPYRSLVVAPADFARQMAWLRTLGYQGLSMGQLLPYLRGEKAGKVVGITLDDGYLNNLEHALPVLQANGFGATCYIVSQQVGRTNVWDADVGIPPSPLMDAAQLRQWLAGGQEIGAHTRHHVHLNQLDAAQSQQEILGCKQELEDLSGSAVEHFCYPYGEYQAQHVAQARAAGYQTVTTTQRGRVHAHDDLLQLPRVPVARTCTRAALWLKVATGYEDRKRV